MATREVTVDAPMKPQLPIDESVILPKHVREAAEKAESFYKPVEAQPEPAIVPIEQAPVPSEPVQEPVAPVVEAAPPQETPQAPPAEDAPEETWRHRYLSMKGRFDQVKRNEGAMAEQLEALAHENAQLQQMIQRPQQDQAPVQPLVTDEDLRNYGPELLDVVKRAAQEAVSPHLSQLDQRTAQMQRAVSESAQLLLENKLDSAVPSWRQVNDDPRFHRWLSLRNVYTNQVRRQMLMAAHAAADAPRVIAIFRDFLQEEAATGNAAPTPQVQQPPTQAPRQAAVPLERLAAPGRAKPAPGTVTPTPAEKPIITRKQIADFYRAVRQGHYAGREAQRAAEEQAIISANNEGRVR